MLRQKKQGKKLEEYVWCRKKPGRRNWSGGIGLGEDIEDVGKAKCK
jgi:hypothetical protein